jgi:hypothetical protein
MLRSLLPVKNNPERKHKIEMATIEEISAMIEDEWKEMERYNLNIEKKLIFMA